MEKMMRLAGAIFLLATLSVAWAQIPGLQIPGAQQQSILDQLRGAAGVAPGGGSLGGGSVDLGGAAGAGGITTITGSPSPAAAPLGEGEVARRRVQELELRKLHQELDRLEAGEPVRNAFQELVKQSVGRELPIFGLNLFRNTPSSFAPLDNVPVTPDYVIGPGDEVVITGWGQININVRQHVDRNGTLSIPQVGPISVAGLKYEQLTDHLKAAFARHYRNFELTATLGRLRSIHVYVVGQAKRPGTYTVSSLSTLVSAIFTVGGPASTGSMRSIQLKRGNRVVVDFDLYDLLIGGDKTRDASLAPGDIIQFTPAGPLVAITGAVNTPAIFELKQGAALFDVLRWAGGLSTTAQGKKVTIERIEERSVRKVEEATLDVAGLSKQLRDGDLVVVHSLPPRFDNAITLRGNVAQPGRFAWRQGMRVRDLIPEKEALLSRDYLRRRNQIVGVDEQVGAILAQQSATGTTLTVDHLTQRRRALDDQATVAEAIQRSLLEAETARFLNPSRPPVGEPQPGRDDTTRSDPARAEALRLETRAEALRIQAARAEAMRLVNQIRPPAHEVNWDYAVVERIEPDLTTSLVPFNLAKALDGDPQHNLLLHPADIVTIFSKDDVQVPVSRKARYVRLEGEINHAGVYEIRPGETLRQLVLRAGGVTTNAYLFGALFTRESTRREQQKNLDDALNRLEQDVLRVNIQRSQTFVSGEEAAGLEQQTRTTQQLINRLRQVRATGRIVLELPEQARAADLPDVALEDGDRLVIPPQPSMVSVFGSVYAENSFLYKPEKELDDYLSQAGGATKSADRRSLFVLRADGSVLSRRQAGLFSNFGGMKLMPGDSIVVPEDLEKIPVMRTLRDVAALFYQFGLGAAAIKVLRE